MDEKKQLMDHVEATLSETNKHSVNTDSVTESESNDQQQANIYPRIIELKDHEAEIEELKLKNNKEYKNILTNDTPDIETPRQPNVAEKRSNGSTSSNTSIDRTPSWKRKVNKDYDNPNFFKYKKATQEYFQFIHKYHPGDTLPIFGRAKLQVELRKIGLDHVNFVLYGLVGSGKSSLLNTFYYTLTGTFKEFSNERKTSRAKKSASVTNSRVELRVTESISIIDNRGLDKSGGCFNEVIKQCEGFREGGDMIPYNWNNTCRQSLRDSAFKYQKKQLLKNRSHCPIIVCSLSEEIHLPTVKKFVDMMKRYCYCNPVIVLTHVDQSNEDQRNRYIELFEDMNCARVFCIENYTHDKNEHNVEIDSIAIEILFNCCLVADQSTSTIINKMNRGACC